MKPKEELFEKYYAAKEGVKFPALAKAFWDAGWEACMKDFQAKLQETSIQHSKPNRYGETQ